ncbi:hypothetical protein MMC28_003708 [Mycoblastus sanguinarius]|nr:hypothetical protein [Mycoblastus sanguinarius]
MSLSGMNGPIDSDEERFKVFDRAYQLGQTFRDTANAYVSLTEGVFLPQLENQGDSEDLIGKWFKRTGKRDEIFLATNFGSVGTAENSCFRSDPNHLKEACAKRLKRLGIESIDHYYCHRLGLKTPIEDTVKAMAELKAELLGRAHSIHPISAVQIEYSPFSLDIEDPEAALLQTCRELGVAIVAYSPLARGFITGSIKSPDDFYGEGDCRRLMPRFSKENFHKNLLLVDELKHTVRNKRVTPAQLTLMAQGTDIFPIPGPRKIKHLEDNISALQVQLTSDETRKHPNSGGRGGGAWGSVSRSAGFRAVCRLANAIGLGSDPSIIPLLRVKKSRYNPPISDVSFLPFSYQYQYQLN